jgi:hypothetical protein
VTRLLQNDVNLARLFRRLGNGVLSQCQQFNRKKKKYQNEKGELKEVKETIIGNLLLEPKY